VKTIMFAVWLQKGVRFPHGNECKKDIHICGRKADPRGSRAAKWRGRLQSARHLNCDRRGGVEVAGVTRGLSKLQ